MNRRSFLRSVSVAVAAALARVGIASAAEDVSEEKAQWIGKPLCLQDECSGCYGEELDLWGCDGCPYGYGTYEAFKEPQLHVLLPVPERRSVNIFVAGDGNDYNNGLSWDTRVKTLNRAMELACAGDVIYVGPAPLRERVVLDNQFGGQRINRS